MRYITTTDTNITFTDVDGKVKIVPKNRVYTHFNVDTVTFLLIERYDNEGICLFSTKASDLQINGETYTYQELLDGEGISDLFSPTGLSFEVVEELPQSGEEGTIYLVPNDHDTYTEYIWIAEEEKWEAIGDSDIDLSNYYTKSQVDALIPTNVSDLTNDAGYITQAEVVINESYPSAWLQSQDMEDLIQAINDDPDAVVGKVYMDTISLSDLPASMQQAEVKVEIMSELQGEGKVLLFTVTSSNISPYHWEYTSAYGNTGTWREWATAAQLNNYYDKTTSDGKYATQTVVNEEIAARIAGDGALNTALQAKADKTDTYTKTQVDTALNAKADSSSLATVATSGSYNDLSNKPTIPAAQVNADWNASSGVAQILNKPTNVSAFTNDAGYLTKHQSLDIYYTKTQVDTALNGKQDTLEFYSETVNEQTNEQTAQIENVYDDGEGVIKTSVVQTYVDEGSEPYVDIYVQEEAEVENYNKYADVYISSDEGVQVVYQHNDNTLNEETSIESHIYADGNGVELYASESANSETVETSLTVTKDGVTINGDNVLTDNDAYTKTQVDTALSAKQDTLTAGTGIDITNNVISATGGGGTQVQSDWNQSDSSAVDYIKNKPTIPDTSDFVTKAEYNPKEVAIANALTQLNDNKADKTELPDTSTFATKTELNGKQDTLTAGQNITIQNNVISATGGGASYQFYTETDEEQEEGTTINRNKNGVIQIADEGGTIDSGMGTFFTQVEEDGSISYTQVNSSMYADKDDGETVNGSTIDVEYNYVSITVSEDGEDNGTQYSKNTDFIVNPDSLTVEVSVDGVTETQLELNDNGLSINGNDVLTDNDAYTKTEIDAMIGNIQTILASI